MILGKLAMHGKNDEITPESYLFNFTIHFEANKNTLYSVRFD